MTVFFSRQLQAALESHGFNVEYTRNVQQGIGQLIKWKPHIVVSDYVLHNMSYFEFAEKIESEIKNVRMVVVSSQHLDQPLVIQLANLSRVSLTVQKPVRPEELVEQIITLVSDIDLEPVFEEVELDEVSGDYGLDTVELEREVAKLQFEGKDLPRYINSITALTHLAHDQPHKLDFFKEAVVQSEKVLESVRKQNLTRAISSFENVNTLLLDIRNNGFHPSLKQWDLVFEELESLSRGKSERESKSNSKPGTEEPQSEPELKSEPKPELDSKPEPG